MSGPLQGRCIVVTRPRAQAAALAALIDQAGGEALLFPLLEISAADDPLPLQSLISRLDAYSLAIFISPNAIAFSLPAILAAGAWPAHLRTAVLGQSSVGLLANYGIQGVVAPVERFDSEALLALPEMQAAHVAGRRVVIFRGNGGRELLADTLRQRGAQVDALTCYQRSPPSAGLAALRSRWAAGRLDALTLSSSEGLRNLCALANDEDRAHLLRTPLFVPHQRIAEQAKACGLQQVVLTAAADAGIIAGLCAYNWQQPWPR